MKIVLFVVMVLGTQASAIDGIRLPFNLATPAHSEKKPNLVPKHTMSWRERIRSPEQTIAVYQQLLPMQQKTQLANYAEQYAKEQTENLELILIGCSEIYCARVQSQNLNKLIKELLTAYDKDAVVIKIKQALSLR